MGLADDLAAVTEPTESGRVEYGPDGGTFEGVTTTEPVTDWTRIFKRFDLDPEMFEVVGDTVRCSTWQQSARSADGHRDLINLYSYRAQFRRRRSSLDLPGLTAAARVKARAIRHKQRTGGALVVTIADAQIGKTDMRGGTPELLDRIEATLTRLDQHLYTAAPSRVILADVGDLTEGFESGGDPHGTNDLSHPEQLDLAATIIARFVRVCADHAPTTVTTVPSNHGRWRRGKQQLGKPTDDYGLAVHRMVAKFMPEADWIVPAEYEEHTTVDVDGCRVAFVHGHQYQPGMFFRWLAGQALGSTSVGTAEVIVTGHYHHLTVTTEGRAPSGRPRWWMQAPTLDNGSAWYRNQAGSDSDPGLLVFRVDGDGLDLASLTIL